MNARTRRAAKTVIWISPGATAFSCLCECCLEGGRSEDIPFLEVVRMANVRGALAPEADVGFARCRSGHELVVRRASGSLTGPGRSERQLQLSAAP